jgi:prefoldin subunit 5
MTPLFGPSKTDTSQSAEIAALQKQLAVLTANFNALTQTCEAWFGYFNKTFFPAFNSLVQRVADGEKLDARQQAALDGLVQTAMSIQQAAKETGA